MNRSEDSRNGGMNVSSTVTTLTGVLSSMISISTADKIAIILEKINELTDKIDALDTKLTRIEINMSSKNQHIFTEHQDLGERNNRSNSSSKRMSNINM